MAEGIVNIGMVKQGCRIQQHFKKKNRSGRKAEIATAQSLMAIEMMISKRMKPDAGGHVNIQIRCDAPCAAARAPGPYETGDAENK